MPPASAEDAKENASINHIRARYASRVVREKSATNQVDVDGLYWERLCAEESSPQH